MMEAVRVLTKLGGRLIQFGRLEAEATHLIFENGNPDVYRRAQERGLFCVMPGWVFMCDQANTRLNEALAKAHPPSAACMPSTRAPGGAEKQALSAPPMQVPGVASASRKRKASEASVSTDNAGGGVCGGGVGAGDVGGGGVGATTHETPTNRFQKALKETASSELRCPLTYALLHDPVTAEDGHLYERRAIQRWLAEHRTSPVTRQPMGARLLPAVQVRSLIERIVESGALPADDAAEWHRERATTAEIADVQRRAAAGSGEHLAQLANWKLRGTHDEPTDRGEWLDLAIRAAGAEPSSRVRLDDARYTSPRARPSLADRLEDAPRAALKAPRMAEVTQNGNLRDLSASMRQILVDWLVEVQRLFDLRTYTLYLGVHFLDLYLSESTDGPIPRSKLQLVGCACLRLAELTNESDRDVHTPAEYAYVTDGAYTAEEVSERQSAVSALVGDDGRNAAVSRTFFDGFTSRLRALGLVRPPVVLLAKYLLELTLPEVRFVCYSPLVSALAALRLAAFTIAVGEMNQGEPGQAQGAYKYVNYVDNLLEETSAASAASAEAGAVPAATAGRFATRDLRASIDDCVSALRAVHVEVSARLQEPQGGDEEDASLVARVGKLHAIYDKYGGDSTDSRFEHVYWSVATWVKPATTDPDRLVPLLGAPSSAAASEASHALNRRRSARLAAKDSSS